MEKEVPKIKNRFQEIIDEKKKCGKFRKIPEKESRKLAEEVNEAGRKIAEDYRRKAAASEIALKNFLIF